MFKLISKFKNHLDKKTQVETLSLHTFSERLNPFFHASLIDLLDEEYNEIPVEIIVCDDIDVAKKYVPNQTDEYWKCVESGDIGGTYYNSNKKILLYTNHMEKCGIHFKIQCAFVFFHELRHAYQHYYLTELYRHEMNNYNPDVTLSDYEEQWLEMDANHFAYEMITRHYDHLSDLCELHFWKVKEYPAPPVHPLQKTISA